MNFTIPLIIFIILFVAIIVLQILALKREGKLFWVLTYVLEFISSITAFIIMTYYDAVDRAAQKQAASVILAQPLPDYGGYSMACLLFSFAFLACLFLSAIICVARLLRQNKR